jgi:transcriptional regulator with PAS, ATPase and Fis domain
MNREKRNFTDDQMLRRNAEELLKKKQDKMNKHVVETDAIKLLHELQVHQIELEMQNEELIKANEAAETALKKYTMLYDFAPMGYFTLDPEGNIYELNFTGAEMLGDKRYSLVNSNFKLFISEESRSVFDKFFTKIYSKKGKESCKVVLGYNGNPASTVYMEGVVTGDDRNCLLSVVDISGFRK